MPTSLSAGPRATGIFLLVTGVLFAVLLVMLGWRAGAAWLPAGAVIVGVLTIVLVAFLARGVGEGRM